MTVVVGSDHAGVDLKRVLLEWMTKAGYAVEDVGTYTKDAVDYPDYAEKVGEKVLSGEAERAVLICGSGVGASVAANKIPGIRAGLCHDVYSAHQGVEHGDMNVLVLGSRVIGPALAGKPWRRISGRGSRGKNGMCGDWRRCGRLRRSSAGSVRNRLSYSN